MLTQRDVIRLMRDPSVDTRVQTVERIATLFGQSVLSETERAIAGDIFRVMTRDVAERVRTALSEHLKTVTDLPHDVALQLASDVDAVSLPMLESSQVLTEWDLVEIVRGAGNTKRQAVARRPGVTERVQDALIDTEEAEVVATLLGNPAAEIGEGSLHRILDIFPEDATVHSPMAHRGALPVTIAERLVAIVSEELREHLATHHALSPDITSDIIRQAREQATLGLASGEEATRRLVDQLHRNGRLTASIVLRAVCSGDLSFFEQAMAIRAGVAHSNARLLIHDKGELGLRALYQRAEMPATHFPLARAALDVLNETALDGEADDLPRFRRRVIERLLTGAEPSEDDSVEYLLSQLTFGPPVARLTPVP
jgi:uncharacterized protein (DUF2336 family)